MLIAGVLVLVLLLGIVILSNMIIQREMSRPFDQTATAIVATNNYLVILIDETQVAATEQFIMTSTALP